VIDGIGGFDCIGRNFSPNPESKRKRIASTEKKADMLFRDSVSINPDGKFDDNNEEEHEKNPGENKDFPGEEKSNAGTEQNYDGLLNFTASNIHRQARLSEQTAGLYSPVALVSDYSIKAVSERIIKYAVVISHGNTGNFSAITAAVDDGFQKAGEALGKPLPQICKNTYDEIIKKLEIWKNASSG
jgi:hypothetical protein